MFKFTIDRKIWLRGEGPLASFLLRESDGKRCCVGIYCRALGIPDGKLLGRKWPAHCETGLPEEAEWLFRPCFLSDNNDDKSISEVTREHKIAAIFAKNDVEVTFI